MTTFAFSTEPAESVKVPLLIVPVFEGPELGPGVRELGLATAYADARLTGKKGEDLLVTRLRSDRFAAEAVLLVGVGSKQAFGVDAARAAAGRVAGTARRFGSVATTFARALPLRQRAEAAGAVAEGLGLGAYRFDRYRSKKAEGGLKRVIVLGGAGGDAKHARSAGQAVKEAGVVVEAVCWARDLVNTPGGDLPPSELAREARAMARQVGLTCKIWNEKQLADGGFNGIIGVGKGSTNPPRMIELGYTGAGRAAPIALAGKGITFDSGGISLKPAKGMETMNYDMSAAASILAAMKVVAWIKPKINVVAVIPCAENMPGGSAQKPGDVITHRGGVTSEVVDTDSEGRLVLADALAYLNEKDPQLIIDAATLTGACEVSLGDRITGAFSNDDDLARDMIAAGEEAGEPIWRLPLFDAYRALNESRVADIKNEGDGRQGAITAAWFLAEFVGDTPWIHLDIAGPAFSQRDHDLGPRGATGAPARTLIRFLGERTTA